jgi:DUF4097 and DUF4098 domain-containing protein YvlB
MNHRIWRILVPCLVILVGVWISPPAQAGHSSTGTSISTEGHQPVESCDQIKVRFGDWGESMPMARAQEELKAQAVAGSPLVLSLSDSGGMSIESWDGKDYAITVCKAAGGSSESKAQQALDQVSASLDGRRFTAHGPVKGDWLVYLIVKAPKDAEMELSTENGGIDLAGVSGKISVKTDNGPISLKKCASDIRATTENGPISLSGGSGNFKLKAENGPISVSLPGGGWEGAGLEARTENGPLELKLSGGMRNGVRVESSGYSPMSCKAAQCSDARKSEDGSPRWIELGAQPATVKLYTVNGPVSIKSDSKEF